MLREKLDDLIEKLNECGNTDCEDEITEFMATNGVEKCKVSIDDMFDSPGYDVYSVAVAWIEDRELQLFVSSIELS